jgi:hypothetical protein
MNAIGIAAVIVFLIGCLGAVVSFFVLGIDRLIRTHPN